MESIVRGEAATSYGINAHDDVLVGIFPAFWKWVGEQRSSSSCQVTRTSNVIPDMRLACFRCGKCGHEQLITNEGGKVDEPQVWEV